MATKKPPAKRVAKKPADRRAKEKPAARAGKKPVGVLDGADRQLRSIRYLLEAMHQPQPDLKLADRLALESTKLEQTLGVIRKAAEDLCASSQAGGEALALLQKASPRKQKSPATLEVEGESAFTRLFEFGGPAVSMPAAGGGIPQGPKLTDIFALVANGLVDAQKSLDKQSLDYISQITDPRIVPALFAIPSVKAAAKLALAMDNESNILVKLFGSPSDKTNYSESTLSFDIVAAPPPPDGLNPVPWFLVVGDERDRVIQKATAAAPTAGVRARSTVFRLPQITAKPYLLILTSATPGAPVQVFRLSLDLADQPTAFNVPNDPNTLGMLSDIAVSLNQWEKTARGANPGA